MKTTFIKYVLLLTLILTASLSVHAIEIEYISSFESNLLAPSSITVDGSSVAVLEPFSKEIKIFTSNGLLQQKLHIKGDANSVSKLSETEYLYCDLSRHIVSYVDLNADSQTDYFANSYSFQIPIDIIVDNSIAVLDAGSKEIILFDRQQNLQSKFSLRKDDTTFISFPNSFSKNKRNGYYYILDQVASEIWIFKPDGSFVKSFGSYGAGEAEITRGGEISTSSDGLVLVSDRYQNRVIIFSEYGNYLDMIPNEQHSADFYTPIGITVDENNLLYVASTESSKIQIFHIAASLTETNAVNTEQLRPSESAIVATENIEFFTIATSQLLSDITAFDIEVYPIDAIEQLTASKYNIVPTKEFDSLQQLTTFSVQWTLTENLQASSAYQWRTRVHTKDSVFAWSEFQMFATSALPETFSLSQNYPNPFNPTTTINFSLAKESDVLIEVFNLNGQKVVTLIDNLLPTGKHFVEWSGKNSNGQQSATGIYFYRITADTFVETKKMVLLK